MHAIVLRQSGDPAIRVLAERAAIPTDARAEQRETSFVVANVRTIVGLVGTAFGMQQPDFVAAEDSDDAAYDENDDLQLANVDTDKVILLVELTDSLPLERWYLVS